MDEQAFLDALAALLPDGAATPVMGITKAKGGTGINVAKTLALPCYAEMPTDERARWISIAAA